MKTNKVSHWDKAGEMLDNSTKPQHTPGPWTLNGNAISAWKSDEHICFEPTGKESKNWEANAHLIAAAPELLEACKEALNYMDDDGYEPIRSKLKQAIAKAEGK